MSLVVRPEALEELESAARWYNERRSGLGDELVDEAAAVLDRIKATPAAFGRYEFYRGSEQVRRAGLFRFPFGLIFVVEQELIGLLAFAADKRRPMYWLDRLRD